MSSDKLKRSARRYRDLVEVRNQIRLYQQYPSNSWPLKNTGRFRKQHSLNCGRSHCMMCVNPRRTWGRKTLKEQIVIAALKYELSNLGS
jgi:hypothetical protein